jgi:hypothetical protein
MQSTATVMAVGTVALDNEEDEGIKTKARRYGFSSFGPWP